jgi:hypothetical protein
MIAGLKASGSEFEFFDGGYVTCSFYFIPGVSVSLILVSLYNANTNFTLSQILLSLTSNHFIVLSSNFAGVSPTLDSKYLEFPYHCVEYIFLESFISYDAYGCNNAISFLITKRVHHDIFSFMHQ